MPKLKNSIINEIINTLDSGQFCHEDFLIDFPDSGALAEITFRATPKYTFVINEGVSGGSLATLAGISGGKQPEKEIRTIERPGDYKNVETVSHEYIESAIRRIHTWVSNLREDIINIKYSIRETLDSLNDEFQKNIDENIENPEDFFEKSEIESLKDKLDELKTRVEGLEKKYAVSNEDIAKLEEAIDKSKSDLDVYPKGVWYKTSGNKILKTMKAILSSKEGRDVLVDMVKKLIN